MLILKKVIFPGTIGSFHCSGFEEKSYSPAGKIFPAEKFSGERFWG
jgi:hypothetical protein